MTTFAVPAAKVTASAAAPAVELGPGHSSTNERVSGLPLPFPSVVANPARLGPPRLNLQTKRVLGL